MLLTTTQDCERCAGSGVIGLRNTFPMTYVGPGPVPDCARNITETKCDACYGGGNAVGDVSSGFHLFMDGDAWCAVGPQFFDLAISDAGFGATHAEAIADLNSRLKNQRWWRDKSLPEIGQFKVHEIVR